VGYAEPVIGWRSVDPLATRPSTDVTSSEASYPAKAGYPVLRSFPYTWPPLAQSYLKKNLVGGFFAVHPSRGPLWRAPRDEVLFRGEILGPRGEERRLRRASNHEAEHVRSLQGARCDSTAPSRVKTGRRVPQRAPLRMPWLSLSEDRDGKPNLTNRGSARQLRTSCILGPSAGGRVYVPFIAILKLPFKFAGHDRLQQAGKRHGEVEQFGRGPRSGDEAAQQ
jgi:hypothetical protein